MPEPAVNDQLKAELEHSARLISVIMDGIGRQVIGQEKLRRRLLTALITEGHILLEGVPGLAKTLSIKALAESIDASFKRVQFTPDLLPADLIGTEVFRAHDGQFEVRKGPVFANFVLADEINRAPAKVQSALLEIMQEQQVTIGKETYKVPSPFLVMATQNPIEQEGTYPLPEAQIDRFLMKVRVDYPLPDEEREMLTLVIEKQSAERSSKAEPVASLADVQRLKKTCAQIYLDDRLRQYIINLVNATRKPEEYGLKLSQFIELGASPRASIALYLAARAEAVFAGEHFVVPQNIKDVAHDVLRHRVVPTYEAEAQALTADDLVTMILDGVQVP